MKPQHVVRLRPRGGFPTFVATGSFGLRNSLSLTLEHELAFELRKAGEDCQDEAVPFAEVVSTLSPPK